MIFARYIPALQKNEGKMREKSEISRILAKEKSLKPLKFQGLLVRHEGLEPPTFAFVVRDSIQLS